MSVTPFREFRAKRLGARVMRLVNRLQSLFHYVSVNLSGENIRMSEHHLDGPKIGSPVEQMGREAVPQRVGLQRLPQASFLPVLSHNFPDGNAVHRASSLIEEQVRRGAVPQKLRPGVFQIRLDNRQRFLSYRNQALLVSLADAAETPRVHL